MQGRPSHDVFGKSTTIRLQRITWTISDSQKLILGGDPTAADNPCHSISRRETRYLRSYRLDRACIVAASHSPLDGEEVDMLPVGGVKRDRMYLDQHTIFRDIWDRVRFNGGFSTADTNCHGIEGRFLVVQEVEHGDNVRWWLVKNDSRSIYVHNKTGIAAVDMRLHQPNLNDPLVEMSGLGYFGIYMISALNRGRRDLGHKSTYRIPTMQLDRYDGDYYSFIAVSFSFSFSFFSPFKHANAR